MNKFAKSAIFHPFWDHFQIVKLVQHKCQNQLVISNIKHPKPKYLLFLGVTYIHICLKQFEFPFSPKSDTLYWPCKCSELVVKAPVSPFRNNSAHFCLNSNPWFSRNHAVMADSPAQAKGFPCPVVTNNETWSSATNCFTFFSIILREAAL